MLVKNRREKMKKRSQIAEKYKWNLKDIYESDEDLQKDIDKLSTYPKILGAYKGKLGKSKVFFEFLEKCTEFDKLSDKVDVYISLKLSENLEDNKFLELSSITSNISKNVSIATSFEEMELKKLGEKYINKLIKDERFKNYRMSLLNFLRNREHILDEKDEIMLSKAMNAIGGYSDVYDNIDTLDLKFESVKDSKNKLVEVNQHNYSELMESSDRVLRKNAYLSYLKGYHGLSNTIASNYIGSVEGDWFIADAYGFKSTLEMSLFGENIDTKIYEKLLSAVNDNLSLMHKFYALKKKALKLNPFYIYDRSVKITNLSEKISYEESYEKVIDAMSILGDEYVEGLKLARDNRWIDVYPCEKKTTGGFCCNMFEPHPYILLNTVNDSRSIYTLAHELGHAMHGYLSAKNQPYQTHDHTIFLAEIASTVNEVLLFKYLYNNSKTKKEKLAHLEKYVSNIIATIYIQTMYSEFEYYAHNLVEQEKPVSKDLLNAKYKELNEKYYGKSVKIIKEDIGETWMRIPHFYRAYYVYKYATGMSSAINFASRIYNGDEGAKEKYLEFLKSGTCDYSNNILKKAGVDLLSDATYKVVFNEIKWALNEMSKLV